jgi:hypothetical protein
MLRNGSLARASALAAALAAMSPLAVSAQYDDVPPPSAYALEDVTLVRADGERLEGVTVVVRGSMIEALARGATIPADAERLEGEGLWVYPGFVDGEGDADVEFPSPEIDRSEVELWNAPRSLQGFMPARRVVSHLTATGEDLDDQRRAGIVAAAVHPEGAMMPGRGAVLLYRINADRPEELVVQADLAPKFELRGARGVYPATLFGVMAFFRQSLEDARYRAQVAQAHARDPEGMTTPSYDPDYEVLREVVNGGTVYFAADEAADIMRVLGLADEYGFRPVIVGGAEAWQVADELRRRGVGVLVDTDFPEPQRWDPDAEEETALDAAAEREKRDVEARYANAGRLAAAGVTFALTSGGSGEILEGARKAVAHGLDADAALGALTSTPATLFGIPHVTRIEAGLPATFVVATGPLFDEETEIAYTFVEGRKEDGSESGPAPGDADEAVDVAGSWDLELDSQGQRMSATMVLEQDGATFTGTMTAEGTELKIEDGVINGNEISMVAVLDQGGQRVEFKIEGTVDGDRAEGTTDSPMGTSRWTGKRTGPGGAR